MKVPQSAIFVVGSMMSGLHEHWRLGDAKFLGRVTSPGKVLMDDNGSARLMYSDSRHTVEGELYAASKEQHATFWDMEGHFSFAERTAKVIDGDGVEHQVEAPVIGFYSSYSARLGEPIHDWREYVAKNYPDWVEGPRKEKA